jgi:hypothetical protein
VKVRRGIEAAALAALAIAAPAGARADGAFPTGEAVLVPADRPQEIILATNFGLVISEDAGQTWSWSCERDDNAFAFLYQLGPAPRRRLFAIANGHVITSDDASCSWQVAGGLLADQTVTDLFADPTNADRVFASGIAGGLAGGVHTLFESADGGATFGATLYQASGGDTINGVESARSDPRIVYVALMSPDNVPKLARSDDGGASWIVNDLGTDLGVGLLRIIAVDPDDARTVFLRWSSTTGGEAFAVTRDGGATATKPLSTANRFTSFARMPDGALIVSGMAFLGQGLGTVPALWLSHDDGATFQENRAVPGVLALAQRDGILYAAADNFVDGFALGASSDEGATWQPVVRFDQITSIVPCLRTNPQCQATCEALAGKGFGSPGKIWEETVCMPADAGTDGGGGGPSSSGCGCTVIPARPAWDLILIMAIALRRRRRVTGATRRARVPP